MENKSEAIYKARQYAFLLLKFRPRSTQEICARLKKKKFAPQTIQETIFFLEDKDFLNDRDFAKSWMEFRLKKPFGLRRIKEELNLKGIDPEIIDETIAEIKKDYTEEDIVAGLAQARWSKLKGIDSQKAKQRIFGYLMRRGFSPEVVVNALGQLVK